MTQLLIRLFIRRPNSPQDPRVRAAYGNLASVVGMVCNILLCLGKFVVGTLFGSIAITADALNNLSDASSNIVSLVGFKLAAKAPDAEHPYGHARFEYLDEFVTASFYAGIAFLKAGCGPVHGMSFPLGGTYHVPHGESNYMLFGAIMDYYDANKPDGEIMKFKELVARILGCEVKDAIPEMNALLQRILPLRPLRDCGFTEADFKIFPQSVETNQQRLMTNAYYPFDLESEEAIYRKCY